MSSDQLEQRLASIEHTLADVQRKVNALVSGPEPKSRWWEIPGPPMTDDEKQAYDESAPYRAYIRQTGTTPPDDWKPGDPIPEPDYWP
jgi:hypothetical protein